MASAIQRVWIGGICALLLAAAPGAVAQCVDDPVDRGALQKDFDYLFAGLDLTLGASFPPWLARYNQRNTTDPTAKFVNEDNCQNGINDDDHLALLAAILDGEPVADVLSGINVADVAAIRSSYAANRAKVRPDLTLQILFVTVNIIDEINKDDPEFGASLQDLVAAYMTIGDAASVTFIANLLITLGEIFIEQGVASGAIPGFVEGLVKDSLRSTVTANFVATLYDSYGNAPGSTRPNVLGASGNIGGSALGNLAEYQAQGGDRTAWLIAKGVAKPPLQVISAPGNTTVATGTPLEFSVATAGGDGTPVLRDWKTVNPSNGQTGSLSTASTLTFAYPLPADTGSYAAFVCDDTWVRAVQPFTLTVNPTTLAFLTQPVGASRVVGESYTFSVTVVGGDAPPTYQWQRGPNIAGLADIPNATGRNLALTNIQLSDAGLYRVIVTSGNTVLESSRAGLVVGQAPDTTPPVVTLNGANPLIVECGAAFVDPGATALDEVSGNLTGSIQATGTVNTSVPGGYTRTYTVADAAGNVGQATRTVTVVDNLAPTISLIGPSPLVVECDADFVDPGVTAFDQCSGDVSATIETSGFFNRAVPGTYDLTYTATDGAGNTSTVTRIFQVVDNLAPVLTLNGPDPLILECGETFVDPGVAAVDQCSGDVGASVETIGSVDSAVPGFYTRSYLATDGSGNSASVSRSVQVVDSTAPVITLLGATPLIVECGAAFSDPGATASDDCGGDLTASIQTSGVVDTATPGDYSLRYTATDPAGNSAEVTRTVTVVDSTVPVIELNGPAEITVECGETYVELGATASDTCGGDLSAAITIEGDVPTEGTGQRTLTYRVVDATGNSAEATRVVNVVDTTPPLLSVGQNPIIVACGAEFIDPGATMTDACDGEPETAFPGEGDVDTSVPGDYLLTYRVFDGAGNSSEGTRTVRVVDQSAPSITLTGPGAITLSCGEAYDELGATALDACEGDLTDSITVSDNLSTAAPGVYTVTYTVTDGAGNTANRQRQVTVLNDCAIEITRQPADLRMYPGTTAVFLVQATGGAGPLAYTWLKDDEPFGAPANPRLELANLDFDDAGAYRCVIDDGVDAVETLEATLEIFPRAAAGQQSADQNGDWSLALSELLRVIQLFNLGAFGCDEAGEDGYVPGALDQDCAPHDTDYNPQDWRFALTELLRAIQFYNTPGGLYHRQEGTEDGLAPGAG